MLYIELSTDNNIYIENGRKKKQEKKRIQLYLNQQGKEWSDIVRVFILANKSLHTGQQLQYAGAEAIIQWVGCLLLSVTVLGSISRIPYGLPSLMSIEPLCALLGVTSQQQQQ